MIKKAFYYAILADGYISLVVTSISSLPKEWGNADSVLIPMGMLSLLVLSVAVMGFLFFYQPLTLLIEGNKVGAIKQFFLTLAIFSLISAVIFGLSFALFV